MMRMLFLILWVAFARFIPGHGLKTLAGRFRSYVGSACLTRSGKNTVIGSNVDFGKGRNIYLGDNSGLGDGSIVKGGGDIRIGNNVVMGPGVMILSGTHRYRIIGGKWKDERLNLDITIHDECFIGAGAIILAGVSIGPRAVVSAGSVITRDVPEKAIVAGVPASYIRNVPDDSMVDDEVDTA